MISTRSAALVIDTVVCLTLAKWETVSGRFGGYLRERDHHQCGELPRIVSNTQNAVAKRGQYEQGERLQDQVSSETNLTMNRIKQTVGADHLLTSALCKRHRRQECSPFKSTTKWGFVALLILLMLGVPASAQDPIAEWLKQDEVEGQIDEVRPDLNALTDQQLQEMFRIGREQVDSRQLTDPSQHEGSKLTRRTAQAS